MPVEAFRQPVFKTPKRAWVVAELEKLRAEWVAWSNTVATIVDHPFDRNTRSDVYADGEANMKYHDVLQAKTLTFLNNNIENHGFIEGFNGEGCDRTDLRLSYRVQHRLHALDTLRSALQYAEIVPTSMSSAASSAAEPSKPISALRAFISRHWVPAAKWALGIITAVLCAYLGKKLAG